MKRLAAGVERKAGSGKPKLVAEGWKLVAGLRRDGAYDIED